MNMRCRLFAGSILCMLALSVVFPCKPSAGDGLLALTAWGAEGAAPDTAAAEPENEDAAGLAPAAPDSGRP